MIFGYSEEELITLGGIHTASEIAQQPKFWNATYKLIKEREEEISNFLQCKVKSGTRVILTGAGSSDYVGDVICGHLNRLVDARVEAIATTDIVLNPDELLEKDTPTLLVSFARSGNSPESVGAFKIFEENVNDITQLVITCNREGELAKMAGQKEGNFVILLPEETNDLAFAMTSSYSCMMLAALLFFDIQNIEENKRTVAIICKNGTNIIENQWKEIKTLSDEKPERLVYLGARCFEGLVQEMALKNLELTNGSIVSIQESVLGFRHGPKTFVNPSTYIVILATLNAYTNQYITDLSKELYTDQGSHKVIVIGYQDGDSFKDICDVYIGVGGEAIPEVFVSFNYLMYAQLLGLFNSLNVGNTPDNPNPAGTVNRVVKGVTLYDYLG